jgi:hypothetical protein
MMNDQSLPLAPDIHLDTIFAVSGPKFGNSVAAMGDELHIEIFFFN